MRNVLNKVIEIFADVAILPTDKLGGDTPVTDALFESREDVDSLDLAEFYCAIEEEFNVQIPDREFAQLKTLGAIADAVNQRIQSRAA